MKSAYESLKDIPEVEPRSEIAEVFYQWRRGEITDENYHIMNAAYVSQSLRDYLPQYPREISDQTKAYLNGRISGITEYSPVEAARLGRWMYELVRIAADNEANVSLLKWSKDKLKDVKIGDAVNRIEALLVRYDQVPLDHESMRKALTVKEMDSFERLRGKK